MEISTLSIVFLAITAAVTTALPIVACIIWRKRTGAGLVPVLAGALTFVVFALVLEQIPHFFFLASDNAISRTLRASPVLYTLYGVLAAGIFEETGRFAAFKLPLRKRLSKVNSIAFGIGHGGIESILLAAISAISTMMLLISVKGMGVDAYVGLAPAAQADALRAAIESSAAAPPASFLWSIWERVFAMTLHISLSVLVYVAASDKKRVWFYPLAILLHAVLDLPAVLTQQGYIPMQLCEVLIALISIACAVLAYRVYKRLPEGVQQAALSAQADGPADENQE